MSLESEMKKAEIKEYNQYTDKYDFGTNTIGIDDAIKIAKANPLGADVIRQTKEMQITGWTKSKKFCCPECGNLLIRDGSRYGCDTCNIDYKLKMKFGI